MNLLARQKKARRQDASAKNIFANLLKRDKIGYGKRKERERYSHQPRI